jgi:hypothetical protein
VIQDEWCWIDFSDCVYQPADGTLNALLTQNYQRQASFVTTTDVLHSVFANETLKPEFPSASALIASLPKNLVCSCTKK